MIPISRMEPMRRSGRLKWSWAGAGNRAVGNKMHEAELFGEALELQDLFGPKCPARIAPPTRWNIM